MKGIGNTPLIRLNHLTGEEDATVYVKYEGANLTGSMKDRMALSMIEGAEARGELKAGGTVIEYTGGSTGAALSMICGRKGYRAHLISSDAFAEEKIQMMRAFGAKVEIIPSKDGKISAELILRMEARVKELDDKADTFWIDQFNNVDNRKGYRAMAREIMDDLGTDIDVFIAGVG
ncbi:MAG: pyridoxal-phosphate dependent enzyme, partial [Flavobacteriales bacterium]|nr:pyridoxal-phosphate dependent enzyme [Flavobacteriales bacterium]